MTSIFIDTNVLIKFIPITEINWESITGQRTQILIAPVVLSELDNLKINKNEKIREKAKKAIKLIESIIEGDSSNIIERSTKLLFVEEPPIQLFINNCLDNQKGDDRLLASVLAYSKKSKNVVLLSDDISIRVRAKQSFNIETIKLPEAYAYNIIEDEKNIHIKKLEKIVQDLKDKEPKLKLIFKNNSKKQLFEVSKHKFVLKEYVEEELNYIKKKYPLEIYVEKATTFSDKDTPLSKFLDQGIFPLGKITKEDIDEHNKELVQFYKKYEVYLCKSYEYKKASSLIFKLEILMINYGAFPADDIRIHFHFPGGFDLLEDSDLEGVPHEPNAPVLRSKFDFSNLTNPLPSYNIYSHSSNVNTIPSNVSGFNIRKSNSFDVDCKVRRLMHTRQIALRNLYVKFATYDNISSFEIEYDFIAENISNKYQGKLEVQINKK